MEINAEQIKKALECCAWDDVSLCKQCPFYEESKSNCITEMTKATGAFIKELTEKNEWLEEQYTKKRIRIMETNYEKKKKVIECCGNGNTAEESCMLGCPLYSKENLECVDDENIALKYALDLINALEQRIEELTVKERIVKALREVPITDKNYAEYIDALAEHIINTITSKLA